MKLYDGGRAPNPRRVRIFLHEKVIGQVLDYIPQINYDKVADPTQTVSLFATTIRHLGGLLSGKTSGFLNRWPM